MVADGWVKKRRGGERGDWGARYRESYGGASCMVVMRHGVRVAKCCMGEHKGSGRVGVRRLSRKNNVMRAPGL